MTSKDKTDLSRMNRALFEALDHDQLLELTCRLHIMAIEMAERLALDSTNSSKPPSSDFPFGGGPASGAAPGSTKAGPASGSPPVPASKGRPPSGRKPGKQPGSKGICRSEPLTTERSQSHLPTVCAHCGTPFDTNGPEQ